MEFPSELQLSVMGGVAILWVGWLFFRRHPFKRMLAKQRTPPCHWGALAGCEAILFPWLKTPLKKLPFDALLVELGRGLQESRRSEYDPDCYGVATYGGVLRDLLKLQKRVTGQNTYSWEQLCFVDADTGEVPPPWLARKRAWLRNEALLAEERYKWFEDPIPPCTLGDAIWEKVLFEMYIRLQERKLYDVTLVQDSQGFLTFAVPGGANTGAIPRIEREPSGRWRVYRCDPPQEAFAPDEEKAMDMALGWL